MAGILNNWPLIAPSQKTTFGFSVCLWSCLNTPQKPQKLNKNKQNKFKNKQTNKQTKFNKQQKTTNQQKTTTNKTTHINNSKIKQTNKHSDTNQQCSKVPFR